MKILLVQTSFLGDTVLSTPVISNLKIRYPNAEIWCMSTPLAAEILQRDPRLTGVITYDKRGLDRGASGLLRKARELKQRNFDKAYVLHRSFRTAMLIRLAGVASVGFVDAKLSFLYGARMVREGAHDVVRNLCILGEPVERLDQELQLFAPEHSEIRGDLASLATERYILVAPGSVWATKMWDAGHFRALICKLSGEKIVIVGSKQEREVAERVGSGTEALNLVGQTSMPELMFLVKHASLVVCNDSVALHLASAFKVPSVAMFCSTVERFGFGPWRNRAAVLSVEGLECRPCGGHGFKSCPTGTNACMRGVTPEEAYQRVRELQCQN